VHIPEIYLTVEADEYSDEKARGKALFLHKGAAKPPLPTSSFRQTKAA
jgi:hypothetical protein